MDSLQNRLTFDPGKKNEIFCYTYRKRILRLAELQSLDFSGEMLYSMKNIRLRISLQILYIFVLRGEKVIIFAAISVPSNITIPRVIYKYIQNLQTSHRYIFTTKLWHFTNFKILIFLAA